MKYLYLGLLNVKENQNGCLEFQGTISKNGYGKIKILDKLVSTHRLSYELVNGKIPEGKMACHKCHNRKCCNVDHIYIGSALQNNSDKTKLNDRKKYRLCFEVPQDIYIEIFEKCCEFDITLKNFMLGFIKENIDRIVSYNPL